VRSSVGAAAVGFDGVAGFGCARGGTVVVVFAALAGFTGVFAGFFEGVAAAAFGVAVAGAAFDGVVAGGVAFAVPVAGVAFAV